MHIDLNCDLGEGCGADDALMPLITSANISCGYHAGDSNTARAALQLAREHRVVAGAHPGFADREHFGRREVTLPQQEIQKLCVEQVTALAQLADEGGVPLRYIKPHGALYNMACREESVALAVIEAAVQLKLPIVGLPGSKLETHSKGRCFFFAEGFADRRYLPDGSLVPRSRADAFIEDPAEAVKQAKQLIKDRGIQTLCVHGDNPQALHFVQQLRAALLAAGFELRAFV